MRAPAALVMLALAACAPKPPGEPAPGEAAVVAAPFGATWDAVIDVMASQNIPISTMERASGFVATTSLSVGPEGKAWADCGYNGIAHPVPAQATYNVRVRELRDSSTVQVTVRWSTGGTSSFDPVRECSTTGIWEKQFAEAVKSHAEGVTVGQHE
jgi:hypothetical protein